ncbi:hypothetical protein GT347_17265 [Xylophilus rhododendri]|uniref:Arginase family protein n=1 Tax=Xylophilus rhododendri TaxID=2697032 RepID=A0A857J6V2_9BURK|nr:hypothetical protein [Xylophilus rhododendri]QHI99566.1 hypothetical protein GT347_17265 [Xylophilus rhododendri]
MTQPLAPVVLDIDRSVGALPGELRIDLASWQELVRFGCGLAAMRRFGQALDTSLPAADRHGTVFFGSGDFHHLSWPLILRQLRQQPGRRLRVVVLDNHPDNMRFPFGVHCGSWVRQVALLPQVSHVHVAGITSGDIGLAHAWENYLRPLAAGKLTYWSCGVETGWGRRLGLGRGFRSFSSLEDLTQALCDTLAASPEPTYFSVDKDVFAPEVVRTNWDQGRMTEAQAMAIVQALRGQIVASDVTGEVSSYRYATAWKRWLSAGDGQDTEIDARTLQAWQAGQGDFNLRLLAALGA